MELGSSDTLSWLGEVWNRRKASNCSDAQAFIVKQGEEGTPVAETCRNAEITHSTCFNWKKKYSVLLPTEMKRRKQFEDENARLKKIVVDLTLDREVLQVRAVEQTIRRIVCRPARSDNRSEAWSDTRTRSRDVRRLGVSIRTACGTIGFDRSTFRYRSRRTDQVAVAKWIKENCETRGRYGYYRRVHVLLDREGWGINVKRVYRIYRDLGMQLGHKMPKRRVKAKLRVDRAVAIGPNDGWAMDLVHDRLATGKKLRVLVVVDTFSRYMPVFDVRYSYPGGDTTIGNKVRITLTKSGGVTSPSP